MSWVVQLPSFWNSTVTAGLLVAWHVGAPDAVSDIQLRRSKSEARLVAAMVIREDLSVLAHVTPEM